MSDTIDTISPAAEAWISGNMDKAQELSQPIPDGPAQPPGRGEVPAYLENHLAVQNLERNRTAAPDAAQSGKPVYSDDAKTETMMVSSAAVALSELGPEGEALVQEWGGQSSPDFKENLSYARDAFKEIAATRPDLIAKVDASGLGNDPAVLKILSELGRQRANTLGDNTVSSRRSSFEEPSRALPRGASAAQAELNEIFERTPPGSPGYAKPSVQRRVNELASMIGGTDDIAGRGGRTS